MASPFMFALHSCSLARAAKVRIVNAGNYVILLEGLVYSYQIFSHLDVAVLN
jgi:hypothetical protein